MKSQFFDFMVDPTQGCCNVTGAVRFNSLPVGNGRLFVV